MQVPPQTYPRIRSSSAQPPSREERLSGVTGAATQAYAPQTAVLHKHSVSTGSVATSIGTEKTGSASVATGGLGVGSTLSPNSIGAVAGAEPRGRGRLRRSWLPRGRSRSDSKEANKKGHGAAAWVLDADQHHAEYSTASLVRGERVPELWDETGDVLVYLFPRQAADKGPSFRVPGDAIADSAIFFDLIQAELAVGSVASPVGSVRGRARSFSGRDGMPSRDEPSARGTGTASKEIRLYVADASTMIRRPVPGQPIPPTNAQPALDAERLVALRNLFAFLTGQPLVATPGHPTLFTTFLQVALLLKEFEFSNHDGSSFGERAELSLAFYRGQLKLEDVRNSREKTLEAIILGEQMRCWDLYHEAFVHLVGKYMAVMDTRSPLIERISPATRQKLERAHIDLVNRQDGVNTRLESFDFPALFAGIAASSASEYRGVRFARWRSAFLRMRSFVLGYYKATMGSWPPRASSKKNSFTESGLNRLVLRQLYSDLCALYDLLVDRSALTPRIADGGSQSRSAGAASGESDGEKDDDVQGRTLKALRTLLDESDHASPPVLPPIPFDVPKMPTPASILARYDNLSAKEQSRFERHIKDHELQLILHKSYNFDTDKLELPFLTEFKEFEHKEAKGKTAADLVDQRIGTWIFLYVVIQSLPMLAVDAPGVRYSEGVEYFLCEPPMGRPAWVEDRGSGVRKVWYEVAGGADGGSRTIVELPADAVMYSVEAIYQRSHCWAAARLWEQAAAQGIPSQLISQDAAAVSSAQVPPAVGVVGDESSALSTLEPPLSPADVSHDLDDGTPLASPPAIAADHQHHHQALLSPSSAGRPTSSSSNLSVGPSPPESRPISMVGVSIPSPLRRPPSAGSSTLAPPRPRSAAGNVANTPYRSSIMLGLAPLYSPEVDRRSSRIVSAGIVGPGAGVPQQQRRPMPRSISMGNLRGSQAMYHIGGDQDNPPVPSLPSQYSQSQSQSQSPQAVQDGDHQLQAEHLRRQTPQAAAPYAEAHIKHHHPRQASQGRLYDMPAASAASESTFDDILKGLDSQKAKKKKNFFGI